jgi:sensor histidine kinase YesM
VELESVLRQSQLQALRSQLNPHFLFNTLHSIAELVHENPKLAETLLVRLGALLRKALAPRVQHEVTLAEEIDFIKGYVEIEQMRLGARLQVEWEIAPEALDCKVPGMILQPLIENSIRHGIGPLDGPGKLKISARRDNEFLHLDLRDNGCGLPQNASARGAGIGLSNTEARLRHLYGERQRLDLINDNGLVVRLRLPVLLPTQTEKRLRDP